MSHQKRRWQPARTGSSSMVLALPYCWSSGKIGTGMRHGKDIRRRGDHVSMLTTCRDELEQPD
jgi:hypothetical protein